MQPVVVSLEDLHWADEMSIRLLPFLARRLEGFATDAQEMVRLGRSLDEVAFVQGKRPTLFRISTNPYTPRGARPALR
jgi:predicted ATPase